MAERQYNQTIWKRTWVPDNGVEITLRVESKRPLTAMQLGALAEAVDTCESFAGVFKLGTQQEPLLPFDAEIDLTKND